MIGSKKAHRAVMVGFGSKRKSSSKLGDSQMSILHRAKDEKRLQLASSRGESFYKELFRAAAKRKQQSNDETECA
ncbi:MAG: hypothetical protein VXZ45_03930 [Verrucomicrobiota bacterium]|nr:hypothetical protein [Pseudomonadota bacterium]MEC8330261.1 hypothetical protein [Verrucomicrobiota bacterium]